MGTVVRALWHATVAAIILDSGRKLRPDCTGKAPGNNRLASVAQRVENGGTIAEKLQPGAVGRLPTAIGEGSPCGRHPPAAAWIGGIECTIVVGKERPRGGPGVRVRGPGAGAPGDRFRQRVRARGAGRTLGARRCRPEGLGGLYPPGGRQALPGAARGDSAYARTFRPRRLGAPTSRRVGRPPL